MFSSTLTHLFPHFTTQFYLILYVLKKLIQILSSHSRLVLVTLLLCLSYICTYINICMYVCMSTRRSSSTFELSLYTSTFPYVWYLRQKVSNEFAERRTKKVAKLHFACQIRGPHCMYSKTCFTMRTRNPKTWIHLMFLDFQVRHYVSK